MKLSEETRFLMKKYGITANKNLGQNFLINDGIVESIVEEADITKEDFIIEIGPGLGTLTQYLVEKAGQVTAIELDKKMITILEDRFALYNNFKLIQKDVLKVDLKELIANTKKENNELKNVKIVANLPYYITTPIIMKLLEEKLAIKNITVMVQKEVADRLTAIPGEKNTGAISYCVNYYCEAQEIIQVPSTSFIPAPKVDSAVIKLNIREKPPINVQNEEKFFKVIKASFMQRRKTLLNGLANSGIVSKDKLKQILNNMKLPEAIRGENLSLEQFAQISNNIEDENKGASKV